MISSEAEFFIINLEKRIKEQNEEIKQLQQEIKELKGNSIKEEHDYIEDLKKLLGD